MAFIFFASTDILSSERTSRFIGPLLRWLKPDISDERIKQVQLIVRKGGHLTEYAILGALLWRALRHPAHEPSGWSADRRVRENSPLMRRTRGLGGPRSYSVHGPNAGQNEMEAAHEPRPSALHPMPLPIRWGEGAQRAGEGGVKSSKDARRVRLSADSHRETSARWQWPQAALALALAVFYALTDEFHQSLTSSRFGSGWDVTIDACGAALGLALIWSWGRFRQRW